MTTCTALMIRILSGGVAIKGAAYSEARNYTIVLALVEIDCVGLVTPKQCPIFSAACQTCFLPSVEGVKLLCLLLVIGFIEHAHTVITEKCYLLVAQKFMIDTIKVTCSLPTFRDVKELKKNETGLFLFSTKERQLPHSAHNRSMSYGWHRDGLAQVAVDQYSRLCWVESSLPKLLSMENGVRQGNGIQIKTPGDLEAGVMGLLMHVRSLCPGAQLSQLPVTRLDLVLNLRLNPQGILPLMRLARHPKVRRETQEFRNTRREPGSVFEDLNTVRFHGVNTNICFYDKVNEVLSKNRKKRVENVSCTRIEIQLTGKAHIAKAFGKDENGPLTLAELDFEQCYKIYREHICEFDSVGKVPAFKPGISSLLAVLELFPDSREYFGGMRPLEWWRFAKGMSDKHFKRLRREVGRQELNLSPFNWHEILPPDRLPDLVDVDGEGREIFVPSPWSFSTQVQTPT